MKSAPIPGKQSCFEILQLFDTWHHQSLVILSFSCGVILIQMNRMVFALYSGTIQLQTERDLKLTGLSAIISPYQAKFIRHNKSNTAFLHEIVITFFSNLFIRDNLCDQLIRCKDGVMMVNSRCNDYSINLQITLRKNNIRIIH